MNNFCKFREVLKCKDCKFIVFRNCPDFKRAYLAFLCKNVKPLKYSKVSVSADVVWSKDANKCKSFLVDKAVEYNTQIVRYTLNQVITIVLSNEDIVGKVFYIDCSSKLNGDTEKLTSVLKSFIDRLELSKCFAGLFVGSNNLNLSEYHKI